MVALSAIAALVLAAIPSIKLLRRTDAGVTWEDWRGAPPIEGKWVQPLSYALGAAVSVGLIGFGLPALVRGVSLGLVIGVCGPFLAEGIHRWRRTGRRSS